MIHIQRITTQEEFDGLAAVWNPLLENSASRTIALTWEWQSTWWAVFGGGPRELNVLVATLGGEIVGIAPFIRRTVLHYGLPFVRLEFIGAGEDEADEICSEYLDIIIRCGLESEVCSAMMRHLNDSDHWDEISLNAIQASSASLGVLGQMPAEPGLRRRIISTEKGSFIELPATYAEYVGRLGRYLKRDIRRDRRVAIANQAELRVIDSKEAFEASFQTLVQLHEARWAPHGKPGAFASQKFTRFHRLLAAKILDKGWLKLFFLYVADRPIAALQVFAYDRKLLVYQSGLIPHSAPVLHPGTLIRDLAIEWAIAKGFAEWDMLRTKVGSYKLRWSDTTRDIVSVRLARSRSKELIYSATDMVVDGLRQIRRAIT